MAKIDNIPLKDHDGFTRTLKGRLNSIKKHYVNSTKGAQEKKVQDEKAIRGDKALYAHCKSPANTKIEATLSPAEMLKVNITKDARNIKNTEVRPLAKTSKVFSREASKRIKELHGSVTPQNVRRLSEGELNRLSKRGLMDYINRHTLEHINPSELRRWDKDSLVNVALKTAHIK